MKNKNKYKDCTYYIGDVQLGKPLRYATKRVGRFCVPNSEEMKKAGLAAFKAEFDKYFGGMNIQKYLADIIAAREVLFITILTWFLIGFVYMIVLRLFGGPMIYMSIIALIIGSALGGYMLY